MEGEGEVLGDGFIETLGETLTVCALLLKIVGVGVACDCVFCDGATVTQGG